MLALVMLVIAIAGCSSPSPTSPPVPTATPSPAASPTTAPTASPLPQTAGVKIQGFAFQPQIVKIAAGGSVTWTNEDGTAHTVKFGDSESPTMGNGATYTKKFDAPGKYDYICGIHTYMKGTVEVS